VVDEAESLPDPQAIERARQGDHEAFRVLVERYQGRAYRLAVRVLRDEERARDAVQEAFLKVYAGLGRFEGRSSFYTWLYRVVMNLCLDMERRERSGRRVDLPDAEALERAARDAGTLGSLGWAGREPGPATAVERLELRRAVGVAIDALPDGPRETLVLREVHGLSYAEIAQVLGIPKGTVMSRLHYARKRVQEALRANGLVDDDEFRAEGEPRSGGRRPQE
jgi:RNA polymerase sigma-70 factor (ECF subfamily)